MTVFFQIALIVLLLNNFVLLGVGRMRPLISLVAFQGCILTCVLLLIPRPEGADILHILLLACPLFAIKALAFPYLLRRTLKKIAVDHAVTPYLSFGLSVLAGMTALVFSLWLETRLPMTRDIFPPLLLPAALTTLLTGLTLVVTRMKALTQVIGYLVAENGIFLLGLPLMLGGSLWFELSILLDVFVAVFVMGIAINHINTTFESIDLGRFSSLRD